MKIKKKRGSKDWCQWKLNQLGEPASPNPLSLFAGDMWSYFSPGDPNDRYASYLQNGRPKFSKFIDSLILYDQITVPTHDYMSIAILIGVLGADGVIELLENNILRIVRVQGALAYLGNGGGLAAYSLLNKDGITPAAGFGDNETALEWALGGLPKQPRESILIRLILERTTTVQAGKVADLIREETYSDILDSPYLKTTFAIRNTDLDHLTGLDSNQLRWGEIHETQAGDEIDTVIKIARANLEMLLAIKTGCVDSTTGTPIGHVLKAKEQRIQKARQLFEPFGALKELARIPDIVGYVIDAEVEKRSQRIHDIVVTRNTRDAAAFRKWFHEECRERPEAVAKELIKILQETPFVSTHPGRTMRLFATTLTGFLGPLSGFAASLADSFLVDLIRKRNPKYFIDDLRQIAL